MKCFYCVQESKDMKRKVIDVKDANNVVNGTGVCFEHLYFEVDKRRAMDLREALSTNRQLESAMHQSMSSIKELPNRRIFDGIFSCFGSLLGGW